MDQATSISSGAVTTLLAQSTADAIFDTATQPPRKWSDHKVLNLGCGLKHMSGAVNLDLRSDVHPDVIHDLNHIPWPFPNDLFSEVLAYDVVEHVNDVVATMEEIHRVCVDGAIVRITVPHFSCVNAFTDITHRHFFGWSSFKYFTGEGDLSFYTRIRFRRSAVELVFSPAIINKVIRRLARRFPQTYEQRLAWIFPAWFIYAELEVTKDPVAGSLNAKQRRHSRKG